MVVKPISADLSMYGHMIDTVLNIPIGSSMLCNISFVIEALHDDMNVGLT